MESLFDEKVSTRTVKTRIASRIFSLNLDSAFEKKFFQSLRLNWTRKTKRIISFRFLSMSLVPVSVSTIITISILSSTQKMGDS